MCAAIGPTPRRGSSARRAAALAAVAVLAGAYALLRDDDLKTYHHEGEPGFTLLFDDERLDVHTPDGALVGLRGQRKGLVATVVVTPLELPEYDGSVTGLLPVYAAEQNRDLDVTVDTRARLGGAPGYEIGYALPDGRGTRIYAVPDEATRRGVVITFEEHTLDEGGGKVSLAARSALRSLEFDD